MLLDRHKLMLLDTHNSPFETHTLGLWDTRTYALGYTHSPVGIHALALLERFGTHKLPLLDTHTH